MAEFDIIAPSFPPQEAPPDPPPEYYSYLASMGISESLLLSTCVKEVEVVGISSIEDNTVNILYDAVEYSDVPVLIHTDRGSRKSLLNNTEATSPADYFERAATLFPLKGGLSINGTTELTKTPLGLALISINSETLEIVPVAVISVLASVDKIRGANDDHTCFPTWGSYFLFRLSTRRFTVDPAHSYYMNPLDGGISVYGDGTPYSDLDSTESRLVLWDVLSDSVAMIPNLSRDAFVVADTLSGTDPASIDDIERFLKKAVVTPAGIEGYSQTVPYIDTDIRGATLPDGTTEAGTVWDGPAWTGEVNYTSGEEIGDTGFGDWDMSYNYNGVRGEFNGEKIVGWRYGRFYYTTVVNLTEGYTLDKWSFGGSAPYITDMRDSTTPYLWWRNNNQQSLSKAGNYSISFSFGGTEYVFERYVGNFSSEMHAELGDGSGEYCYGSGSDCLGIKNGSLQQNFNFIASVTGKTGDGPVVDIDSYSVEGSINSSADTDIAAGITSFYFERYSVAMQDFPTLFFADTFITPFLFLYSYTASIAKLEASEVVFGDVYPESTAGLVDKSFLYKNITIGGRSTLNGLVGFIDSIFDDFAEPGADNNNNPVVIDYVNYVPRIVNGVSDCMYNPDSIYIEEGAFCLVPYDMRDALIPE